MGTAALQQCATVGGIKLNGGLQRLGSCAHFTAEALDVQGATITRTSGVWSGFWCKVLLNDATGFITFQLKVTPLAPAPPPWLDGNQVITVPAATTGIFQDLANTDVVSEPTYIYIRTTAEIVEPAGATVQIFQILFTSGADERVYRLSQQTNFPVDGFAGCQNSMQFGTGVAETFLQMSVPAGTFRNADVDIPFFNIEDDTTTLVLRVNAADSALAVVIPAATTGIFSDLVNQVTVVARDKVNWECRKPGTGGIAIMHTAIDFVTPIFFGGGCVSAGINISATSGADAFCSHSGWFSIIGDESFIQAEALVTDSWEGIIVNVKSNGQTDTVEFRGRTNGADNALLVVVPALATGFFESTGGPVAVVPTDLINLRRLTNSLQTIPLIYHVHNFFGGSGGKGPPRNGEVPWEPPDLSPCPGPGDTGAARDGGIPYTP